MYIGGAMVDGGGPRLLSPEDRAFAESVSRLIDCNPFLPERIENERAALGGDFVAEGTLWHIQPEPTPSPNLARLHVRVDALAGKLQEALAGGALATAEEIELYGDLVLYLLFYRYEVELRRLIENRGASTARVTMYRTFARDVERYLGAPAGAFNWRQEAPHLFACFFQLRRAFHFIFRNIQGGSMPVVRLRAAAWQSIFTRDIRRYRRALYARMGDIATLITGPSGTGKELVAQAIGLARYIPFDPGRETFTGDFVGSFYTLNPSALSPTLIESELFGHRRGAFTGAVQDRAGWLEVCPPLGTVFLDEIGEVDVAIQVKLLRVLQTRVFQRLGDTRDRAFHGKIVAATNRDLAAEIRAGRFRQDFYYRLCSDMIVTPSLAEQLADSPEDRGRLVRFIARRVAGESEAERLTEETENWIDRHLGSAYPWPGNVRELEQCVRNVMIRGEYRPPRPAEGSARAGLADTILAGALSADELLRLYCTLVYARVGSYQEAARRLGLDRRTVKEKIDPILLERLRTEEPGLTAETTKDGGPPEAR